MMSKKVKELQSDLIGTKQLLEQAELRADKAEGYIEEHYPAITNMEITKGWHSGASVKTYKVIIECYAEDLLKLIHLLTHRNLSDKKWSMIDSELQARIRKEVEEEFNSQSNKKQLIERGKR